MNSTSENKSSTSNSWMNFAPSSKSSNVEKSPHTNIDELTKILGYINDEYQCVHNNFSGTLYAGPLALVFLGRIFFFEWTVVIKWEDVVSVKKEDTGISVEVQSPKPVVYEFEQVFNPDKAWSSLVSLHNDSILDTPNPVPTPRQLSRSLRRMNSDPLLLSKVFNFDGPPTVMEETFAKAPLKPSRRISRSVSVPAEAADDQILKTTGQDYIDTGISSGVKGDLKQEWAEILDDTTSYGHLAVEDHELPCNLESFFTLFVAGGAEYAIPSFMKESGDEKMNCTEWEGMDDGVSKSRTLEYTHPVNAPMAPPMARARKEQTYRRYGQHGLVLETKTFVSDVPMTDCFYVADMLRVEPVGEAKVVVSMYFDIRFVKSTMFRTIISRTTKGEFEKFMKRFANFMANSLGEQATITVPVRQSVAVPPPPSPMTTNLIPNLTVALLITVLLLQVWIILDMRTMKNEFSQLQGAWTAQCDPNVVAVSHPNTGEL